MFFHALVDVKSKEKLHFDVVGDGFLRPALERQVKESGLENIVTFHGKLPREQAVLKFKNSHLHIITSMGEGNPTTIWEAMSFGVPTLTLDHCGMHDIVKDSTGFKIPLNSDYGKMVNMISDKLNEIVSNPEVLRRKALEMVRDSENYQWSNRIDYLEMSYDKCIAAFKSKKM